MAQNHACHPMHTPFRCWCAACAVGLVSGVVTPSTLAQTSPVNQLSSLLTSQGTSHPSWRFVGFPKQHADLPPTRFEAGSAADNRPGIRVTTARSYGTLVHDWQGPHPETLQWIWRLDKPLTGGTTPPNLTTKAGDDAALKLCVMFDHPLDRVPFLERTLLRLARSISGEALPAATVCYVWDSAQPAGLSGANPYTKRVRYISLRGTEAPLNTWLTERRQPDRDYLALFKDEVLAPDTAPTVTAVVLGADSDNTGSSSVGWFALVQWQWPAASSE